MLVLAKCVLVLTKVSLKLTHCEWKFTIWGCVYNYSFIVQESQSDVGSFCYGVETFLDEHVDSISFTWWSESNTHVCQSFQCPIVFCHEVGYCVFWMHLELLEICYCFVVVLD